MSKNKLIIFDTTLRDGEQSPGASMTKEEKVRIAKMLDKMKVDVIEAGFAIASDGDFESIQAVSEAVKHATVCSLARTSEADIRRAADSIAPASNKRIHTFIATSPIHMKYKLRMQPDDVLAQAVGAVTLARSLVDDVEFSLEDGSRTEYDFACRVIEAAIAAGASTINIPDTVGYAEPGEYGAFIGRIINNVPNADQAIFSVHCHNDLGLAVASSLAAVANGARQVECTINGLGERAGNASLEEIVMAIRTRADLFDVETDIDATLIVPTSRLVSGVTGFPVQPNKAIVGANAFAHESGIHQDGVLKFRETYEIMKAQDVGWSENRLVLGKHSGRAAMRARMEDLGFSFSGPEHVIEVFKRFKELADKKHEIFDEDLQVLMGNAEASATSSRFSLVSLKAVSETGQKPLAEIEFSDNGEVFLSKAEGDGPVDAAFKAIESQVNSEATLKLYSVNAITSGTDSQGEVTVRLEDANGRIVNGQGADTDIVVASAKAYFDALNLLLDESARAHPQYGGI